MTPGDIAMLLNETAGLRVQVTSPSLGAASLRVQGLRGRYTQLLADGLPLYGGQSGSIGLLQIPPMDLGQVEIIKGVASSLFGSTSSENRPTGFARVSRRWKSATACRARPWRRARGVSHRGRGLLVVDAARQLQRSNQRSVAMDGPIS